MFEPDIFTKQVFPHRFTWFLKMDGYLAMRVILLTMLVFAALNLPGAASAQPPLLPDESHPTADRQAMLAILDAADSEWKVAELTGRQRPVALKCGEPTIWMYY